LRLRRDRYHDHIAGHYGFTDHNGCALDDRRTDHHHRRSDDYGCSYHHDCGSDHHDDARHELVG
jgi:hypothetical protein